MNCWTPRSHCCLWTCWITASWFWWRERSVTFRHSCHLPWNRRNLEHNYYYFFLQIYIFFCLHGLLSLQLNCVTLTVVHSSYHDTLWFKRLYVDCGPRLSREENADMGWTVNWTVLVYYFLYKMTNPTYSGSNYKEMTVCYFSSVLIVLKLNLGIRLNTQLKYIDVWTGLSAKRF